MSHFPCLIRLTDIITYYLRYLLIPLAGAWPWIIITCVLSSNSSHQQLELAQVRLPFNGFQISLLLLFYQALRNVLTSSSPALYTLARLLALCLIIPLTSRAQIWRTGKSLSFFLYFHATTNRGRAVTPTCRRCLRVKTLGSSPSLYRYSDPRPCS